MKKIKLIVLIGAVLILGITEYVSTRNVQASEGPPDCNCYDEVCCGFRGEYTRHCPLPTYPEGLMFNCFRDPDAGNDSCEPECCHWCGAEPEGCYGCPPE